MAYIDLEEEMNTSISSRDIYRHPCIQFDLGIYNFNATDGNYQALDAWLFMLENFNS